MHISSKGLSVISSVHILAVLRYAGPDVYMVVASNVKLPLSSAYEPADNFIFGNNFAGVLNLFGFFYRVRLNYIRF